MKGRSKGKDKSEPKTKTKGKVIQAPTGPFTPGIPQVNLLPPDVIEVVAVQAVKRKVLAAGVGLLAIVAVLYGGQIALIASANSDLSAAKGVTADLSREMASLAPVKAFYGSVDANQKTITSTMKNEVLYSAVFSSLEEVTPRGVSLTNVNIASVGAPTTTAAAGTPCPGPDPFNPVASVGCVNITGTADSRDAIGSFLTSLDGAKMFASPYVSATTANENGEVSFTATVGLTEEVYSHRYDDVNFLRGASK